MRVDLRPSLIGQKQAFHATVKIPRKRSFANEAEVQVESSSQAPNRT